MIGTDGCGRKEMQDQSHGVSSPEEGSWRSSLVAMTDAPCKTNVHGMDRTTTQRRHHGNEKDQQDPTSSR